MRETDGWTVICLELSSNDPLRAKELRDGCTLTEIAMAWQNNRRAVEGIGYKVKN
jgi:hypothetical protein